MLKRWLRLRKTKRLVRKAIRENDQEAIEGWSIIASILEAIERADETQNVSTTTASWKAQG